MLKVIQFTVALIVVALSWRTFQPAAPASMAARIEAPAVVEQVGPAEPYNLPAAPPPTAVATLVVTALAVAVPVSPPTVLAAKAEPGGCPDGGPRVSQVAMIQWASAYDWGGYTPNQMGALFDRESGGCVGIISRTGDHGCTQMHLDDSTAALWDFSRIRSDCAYAIQTANDLYWRRVASGLRGITAWNAGQGWLW